MNIFEKKIIKNMIKNFFDDAEYYPDRSIPKNIYEEGKYIETNYYHSSKYINGMIKKQYNIQIGEIEIGLEQGDKEVWEKLHVSEYLPFHGLFAKIEMKKAIPNSIQIRKYTNEQINMDSIEFEKYFDVCSDDQITAMQLLTHDTMELMIEWVKRYNIQFDVSIYGNKMYLRFFTGSIFDIVSVENGKPDEKELKKYYDILEFVYILSTNLIDLIEKNNI